MPVGDYILRWWETEGSKRANNTRSADKTRINRWILPFLGDVSFWDFGVARARKWSADILRAGARPPTHNRARAIFHTIMNAAMEENLVPANPIAKVKKMEEMPKKANILTCEQVERVRAQMPSFMDSLIPVVMAYAGLRTEEAFALSRDSYMGGALEVWRAIDADGTLKELKTSSEGRRTIKLAAPAADDLETYLSRTRGRPREFMFPARDGRPIGMGNWRRRVWQRAIVESGLWEPTVDEDGNPVRHPGLTQGETQTNPKPRPYDCRHTFATLLIYSGEALPMVSYKMGHSSLETTLKWYVHVMHGVEAGETIPMEESIEQARQLVHGPSGLQLPITPGPHWEWD